MVRKRRTYTAEQKADADEIHRYLVEAFRIGNRARLRFARLLAALASSRMYVQLGHPSITQYAECLADLADALERLGLPKRQARGRLERAFAELRRRGDDPRDEQKLLTLALTCF